MQIHIPKKLWFRAGHDPYYGAFSVSIGFGWDDRGEGWIPWRHHWRWTPNLPRLLYRARDKRVIGICLFGRWRVWGR